MTIPRKPQAARAASGRAVKALPPLAADSLAQALTIAAGALAEVLDGRALNDGLASVWRSFPDLPASTRGAAQDMLYGTLRDFGRGGLILDRLLSSPLNDARIAALLRVALHRIEVRPDTTHTVVDQAVECAARLADGRFKGLVNGVLRNALRQWPDLQAQLALDPVCIWRHPQWWIKAVKHDWPRDWQAILQANNSHPPMSLRINPQRSSAQAYRDHLQAAQISYVEHGALALQLERPCPVAQLPGYSEGEVSVQDWGAQQAAALLDLHDGQRVLDACAAPGGKTAHLLETARIDLLALELDAKRALRVRDNLERLGLQAAIEHTDCCDLDNWWDGQHFDRILADVPCSASGVVRRHPDIKWLRRQEDVARFATVQAEILESLWITLAPGGKMLYLTCSVFAEENSTQVARFAGRHADCRRLPFTDGSFERQLLPGPLHDGFFYALLEKTA